MISHRSRSVSFAMDWSTCGYVPTAANGAAGSWRVSQLRAGKPMKETG
jgi:hypothetical protein